MTDTDVAIAKYVEEYGRQDWTRPCGEMVRLREMLDAAGVGWHETRVRHDNGNIWRTISDAKMTYDGAEYAAISVVWGPFTFGGPEGLLEVFACDDKEPTGYLTAQEAFEAFVAAVDRADHVG